MPSTYSSRLRLELIADGEQAGIWGQSTNRNLGTLIETAIAGYRTIALLDANYTLTASNGLDDEARYAILNFTGTLTATREVVVPAVSKLYVVRNQTNQTLNVKTSGGSARAVPAGKTVYIFIDGTNAFDSLNDLTTLSVSGTTTLGVASATNLSYTGTLTGGTGEINIGSGQFYKSAAGAFGFGTTSTLGFRGVFAETAGNSLALLKPTATLPTESVRLRYYSANTNDGGTYDLGGVDYLREDGGFGVRSIMVVNVKTGGGAGNLAEAARFTSALDLEVQGDITAGSGTVGSLRTRNTGSLFALTALAGAAGMTFVQEGVGEAARFAGRYFKASNTGSYGGVAGYGDLSANPSHTFQSNVNNTTISSINSNLGSVVTNFDSVLAAGSAGRHFQANLNTVSVFRVLSSGSIENATNSYGAISDAKLKENVTDAPSYLQKFMQVRFRKYNMIGSDLVQFGVVAQELEAVFPGLIDTTPDVQQVEVLDEETGQTRTESVPLGTVTRSVKYSVLAAMQGKVIQEQQQLIQAQQAQIESILNRLAALESAR